MGIEQKRETADDMRRIIEADPKEAAALGCCCWYDYSGQVCRNRMAREVCWKEHDGQFMPAQTCAGWPDA
jgi:hypothetical protein